MSKSNSRKSILDKISEHSNSRFSERLSERLSERRLEKIRGEKEPSDEHVNSFFVPKETIQRMNELNHKTHSDGREHGMSLCMSKENRVIPGHESTGDEVSINIPETCKNRGDKYLGSFHTHPAPSETKFSAMDLFSSCDARSKIDCVGMNREGEIECYAKKNQGKSCMEESKPFVDIEDTYIYLNEEDKETVQRALLAAVDNFVAKKFNDKKIL